MERDTKERLIGWLERFGWNHEVTDSGVQARKPLDPNGDFELMVDLSDGYFHYAVWDWRTKDQPDQRGKCLSMVDSIEHFAKYTVEISMLLVEIKMSLQLATDTYVSVFERGFRFEDILKK